ncbi:MAG: sporulation protein YqfD [Oscillospiraceae bacterium]|nr:sporulation protein YqfD [Oscillospiraceae bacterium]
MMKRRIFAFKGVCRAELSGAYPETLLNACAMNALEIWDMRCPDTYTLTFSFYERDKELLYALARKSMCEVTVETVSGGSRLADFVKRHGALFIGFAAVMLLLAFSTLFIWDMKVYGNKELTDGEILRVLADCGVDCGSFWPGVDKELLRSEVLLKLPELAWMTVNVNSSRASVVVSERIEKPEIYVESEGADLVAEKTGIIKNISALNGKVLVEEGDSVLEGEVLVSGLMDSITAQPRLVRAQGQVMAETWLEKHSVSPTEQNAKISSSGKRIRIALKFGKKRLNFYPGGRKTVDGCDKIIDNYIIGIDGIFALPVTVIVEKILPYEIQGRAVPNTDAMAKRLYDDIKRQVDGEILSHSAVSGSREGLDFVSLRAACLENIAGLYEYKTP